MPLNASGVYSLPAGYLGVTGQPILPDENHNNPLQDMAAALSLALYRDGRAAMSAPLVLSGNAVAALQAVPKQQFDLALKAADSGTFGRSLLATSAPAGAHAILGGAFQTRTEFVAATIPATGSGGPSAIMTLGRASAGDMGGAVYQRLGSAPGVVKAYHAQTADGAWWSIAEDTITPIMMGAVGNNIANDAAALQACADYLAERGSGRLDLLGKTYLVNTGIVAGLYFRIENGTLRAGANNMTVISQSGTQGPIVNVTASVPALQEYALIATGHGFAAGDMLWMWSDEFWSKNDNLSGGVGGTGYCRGGEFQRASNVGSTFAYFHMRARAAYTTNPKIRKITLATFIADNVAMIGNGDLGRQTAISLTCATGALRNVRCLQFGDRGINALRCYDLSLDGSIFRGDLVPSAGTPSGGYPYGIVIGNGTTRAFIRNTFGEGMKHAITLGNTDGVDRDIVIDGFIFDNCFDSLDLHAGASEVTIANGYIRGNNAYSTNGTGQRAGLTIQGAKVSVSNVVIDSTFGPGIAIQLYSNEPDDYIKLKDVTVTRVFGANYVCIFQNVKWGGSVENVDLEIDGRATETGGGGIEIVNYSGAPTIRGLDVNGRIQTVGVCLNISAGTTVIEEYSVRGTYRRTNNSGVATQLAEGAANRMLLGRFDAIVIGGNIGLNHGAIVPNITGSQIRGHTAGALSNAAAFPIAQRDTCVLAA